MREPFSTKLQLLVISLILTSLFLILSSNKDAFAIQYSNYTSTKYQIQFQYPTAWEITEKQSRFDEGTDIKIQSFSYPNGLILISYVNFTDTSTSDFTQLVYQLYKNAITSDYSKEIKVIEQPSFLTIDGHKTGTYLYTSKDKYDENAVRTANQNWIVVVDNNHGYLLWFSNIPENYDKPEVTEIRDHFIKSVKFLGVENSTQTNQPSRFD